MSNDKIRMSHSRNIDLPEHPMIEEIINLIYNTETLVIGECRDYVMLSDEKAEVFYRFDKTPEGYTLVKSKQE